MRNALVNSRRTIWTAGLSLAVMTLTLSACDQSTSPPSGNAGTGGSNGAPAGDSLAANSPLPEREGQRTGGAPAPAIPDFKPVAVDPSKSVQPTATPPAATPSPSTPSPAAPPAVVQAEVDPAVAMFAGLSAPKPATWQARAPQGSSGMRVAEFSVPGADGGDQADIIVYQFPGGGSAQANIERWKSQFKRADNSVVEAATQELQADGMAVTVAEIAGDYRGMGKSEYAPDQILIAAMIETDGDPVFVQFVGPSKTVTANREAFLALVRGVKKTEPMK